MYNLTFNNFDSLSHSRVYFAACLTIVFNFETKKEKKEKENEEKIQIKVISGRVRVEIEEEAGWKTSNRIEPGERER